MLGHPSTMSDYYGNEGNSFLGRIVIGDEIWSIIESWRVNGRVWNGKFHNRPAENFKSQLSTRKQMLTVSWE
jgi:hypothetical protein